MKKFSGWLLALCLLLSFAIGFAACTPQDPVATEYTVTFDSVGGTAVASQTLGEGEKVAKPADPTKDGNTFAGWWKESTYETEWDFREDVVTGEHHAVCQVGYGEVYRYLCHKQRDRSRARTG